MPSEAYTAALRGGCYNTGSKLFQKKNGCSAMKLCQYRAAPVNLNYQCQGCGFLCHSACSKIINPTLPSQRVCLKCLETANIPLSKAAHLIDVDVATLLDCGKKYVALPHHLLEVKAFAREFPKHWKEPDELMPPAGNEPSLGEGKEDELMPHPEEEKGKNDKDKSTAEERKDDHATEKAEDKSTAEEKDDHGATEKAATDDATEAPPVEEDNKEEAAKDEDLDKKIAAREQRSKENGQHVKSDDDEASASNDLAFAIKTGMYDAGNTLWQASMACASDDWCRLLGQCEMQSRLRCRGCGYYVHLGCSNETLCGGIVARVCLVCKEDEDGIEEVLRYGARMMTMPIMTFPYCEFVDKVKNSVDGLDEDNDDTSEDDVKVSDQESSFAYYDDDDDDDEDDLDFCEESSPEKYVFQPTCFLVFPLPIFSHQPHILLLAHTKDHDARRRRNKLLLLPPLLLWARR